MDFKFFKGKVHDRNTMWKDAAGRDIPVFYMTRNHIINCMRCINGYGQMRIPNPHVGKTHEQWMEIFTLELTLRNSEGE